MHTTRTKRGSVKRVPSQASSVSALLSAYPATQVQPTEESFSQQQVQQTSTAEVIAREKAVTEAKEQSEAGENAEFRENGNANTREKAEPEAKKAEARKMAEAEKSWHNTLFWSVSVAIVGVVGLAALLVRRRMP